MTILRMESISIEFPGVKALDHATFQIETGEVHALLGANGAGKSTLMKVLSGAYSHYTGSISFDGVGVEIRSPKDAQSAGVQIVYQEVDTALISYLSVAENIMLNETVNELGKKQLVSWSSIHEKAKAILDKMNIRISSKTLVNELTLAEKQMVLIARAVRSNCQFLILDEPTAPLSQTETNELFRIVAELKASGVGIIFISHRLPEIFQICDGITVMRNGQFVQRLRTSDVTQNEVIEKMLGKKLEDQYPGRFEVSGERILEVRGLSDKQKVHDVHFHVHAGEILGIAGLVGAGKTELCKALFGNSTNLSGDVLLKGKKLKLKAPHQAVQKGLALVPEERRKEGVLVTESVTTNLTAASLSSFTRLFGFLNVRAERKKSVEMIRSLGIKTPSELALVEHLSGGNQQKIAIGKWLIADADVYMFDEPTKGVDVGAKKDIFLLIQELAKRGKAIIYASSELAELVGVTNRVYVMYDGKMVKEVQTAETNEEELLYFSTGGN
ncbi:sugar ABC transporter ATP-binding protein [Halalkalibacter hemicellulosilyticus]|uniref:Ribose ABC transport system n=1 Tax=Halalkalibacter hemicellulosilyticusJCM 9152 TaxID=1236971 RepID=W4QG56_9BACI|nr:sugar ABC transporter ATP-binding protein [Halalkalibacter hemicellulosilyticus]GAE31080.1 ribose ABC transport system [Halalkalibacter hemicellulosilyticusJCM 9152]